MNLWNPALQRIVAKDEPVSLFSALRAFISRDPIIHLHLRGRQIRVKVLKIISREEMRMVLP